MDGFKVCFKLLIFYKENAHLFRTVSDSAERFCGVIILLIKSLTNIRVASFRCVQVLQVSFRSVFSPPPTPKGYTLTKDILTDSQFRSVLLPFSFQPQMVLFLHDKAIQAQMNTFPYAISHTTRKWCFVCLFWPEWVLPVLFVWYWRSKLPNDEAKILTVLIKKRRWIDIMLAFPSTWKGNSVWRTFKKRLVLKNQWRRSHFFIDYTCSEALHVRTENRFTVKTDVYYIVRM